MTRPIQAGTVVVLVLACYAILIARSQQTSPPPRFRVSVDAVRIDAVVTDREGRIVSDLTAEDFEVLQDGKPQKVTFAQFIPVNANPAPTAPRPITPVTRDMRAVATAPAAVERSAIQRTLAIVVDDLGLSFESLRYSKDALHTFVDRDLQPTDLVGVIRTAGSNAVQPFTTDRRILHAAIDALRWNGLSRSGVGAFDPINQWIPLDARTVMADGNDFSAVDALRRSMSAAGTLGALNLAIRGARDLPGRKALMFVSEGFQLLDREGHPDGRVRLALERVLDQATRAGVVIYSLDARGLQAATLTAEDNLKAPDRGKSMEETVRTKAADRVTFNRDTQEGMAFLAEQTGGFAVLNHSDLAKGLGRISADVRDYYLIGYFPDEGTFAVPGKRATYHKLQVRTRRPGLRIRTRKEFLGVSDAEEPTVAATPAQELITSALSPFTATDIGLLATCLPGYDAAKGLFVRALLHIDARGLTFVDEADGKKTASADVLGMVFDPDGTEVAHLSTGFSVGLSDQATEDALRDGLAYTLRIPIPRDGAYQVRFAVRDKQSGRLGSAGEFVQLADIPHGAFALSGIVLREDGAAPAGGAADAGAIAISPSQALPLFHPGGGLRYAYEIYNAGGPVQSTASLWRGPANVATLPPDTLTPPAGGGARFAAAGRLKLGALPAGSYTLRIAAATGDPKRRRSMRMAVQQIPFDLR